MKHLRRIDELQSFKSRAKYAYNAVRNNWDDKRWWELNFLHLIRPILFRTENGSYVTEEDWDNLIILDACRYDTFKELNTIEGKLESRISRGSCTSQFLWENFGKGEFKDIVYITANPWVSRALHGKFHRIINVWDKGWDEALCTVLPQTVYDYTVEALSKYQGKRFIIHFMQPHMPFINPYIYYSFDTEIRREMVKFYILHHKIHRYIKEKFEKGEISKKIYIEGYKENLKLTLPYVKRLVNILNGKTIVTSDHGEAFGEFVHPLIPIRIYSHPCNFRINTLTKVSWLIVKGAVKHSGSEKERIKIAVKKLRGETK